MSQIEASLALLVSLPQFVNRLVQKLQEELFAVGGGQGCEEGDGEVDYFLLLLEVVVADCGELIQLSDEGADCVGIDAFLAEETVNLLWA